MYNLVAIDIETKCAVPGCPQGAECRDRHKHALHPHQNQITVIGVYGIGDQRVFRDLDEFVTWVRRYKPKAVGHNFKFDLRNLFFHTDLTEDEIISMFAEDTQLMAYVLTSKIPDYWLERYEIDRVEANKSLPVGIAHRKAGPHSLKTLAPFFLGKKPFWEDPANHDSDEYVLMDCQFTFELYFKLKIQLKRRNEWNFYEDCQLKWARELLRAEIAGIKIDRELLETKRIAADKEMHESEAALKEAWAAVYKEWADLEESKIRLRYQRMCDNALDKGPKEPEKTKARYHDLMTAKLAKANFNLNLDSPLQLKWVLKEYFGFDIYSPTLRRESTDRESLELLAAKDTTGGVRALLRYRAASKLVNAYFPAYQQVLTKDTGRIHASFNTSATRTGRLSSSSPNLQQVPPSLRDCFVSDEDEVFITRDLSAIEPRIIAYYSEDEVLTEIVKKGMDFHGATATAIFSYINCENKDIKAKFPKERRVAKTAGLAILYGAGAGRLKNILDKEGFTGYDIPTCKDMVQNIRNLYSGVWQFKKELDRAMEKGEIIKNFLGRPLIIEDPEDVYMKALNKLVQSSASDIVLESILRFNHQAKGKGKVVLAVHDEIVAGVKKAHIKECEEILETAMTDYPLDDIPLAVEGETTTYWSK